MAKYRKESDFDPQEYEESLYMDVPYPNNEEELSEDIIVEDIWDHIDPK